MESDRAVNSTERGNHMRRARRATGMSILTLSCESGVSYHSISNWERGMTEPTLVHLVNVADILGISIDEYIGRKVKEKNEEEM